MNKETWGTVRGLACTGHYERISTLREKCSFQGHDKTEKKCSSLLSKKGISIMWFYCFSVCFVVVVFKNVGNFCITNGKMYLLILFLTIVFIFGELLKHKMDLLATQCCHVFIFYFFNTWHLWLRYGLIISLFFILYIYIFTWHLWLRYRLIFSFAFILFQ